MCQEKTYAYAFKSRIQFEIAFMDRIAPKNLLIVRKYRFAFAVVRYDS